MMPKITLINPKFEYQNPKQIQNSNVQNSETDQDLHDYRITTIFLNPLNNHGNLLIP